MGGRVIRAVPITQVDFSNVKASSEVGYRIAQHIDVSQFRFATMAVRLHEENIVANGVLKVKAFADGYTTEDPAKTFGDPTQLAEVQIDANDTAGFFETVELTAGKMGALVTIVVSGAMPATTGAFTATISIDLVLKD